LEDSVKANKSGEILVAWSKAASFDMTLMFIEDDEKKILDKISKLLEKN